jgi:predicted HAD superfamily Cof-like phosphohydrolase
MLQKTVEWFQKAVPNPDERNFHVQLGCHLEELAEMLESLEGVTFSDRHRLKILVSHITEMSDSLKGMLTTVQVHDRKEFLDALADQVVTACGLAYMKCMDLPTALERVNRSNFSKFDNNGKPVFDANGKIVKSELYQKPDLTGLYE